MFAAPLREWLNEMSADELATRLTGGLTVPELPEEMRKAIGPALRPDRLRPGAAAEPALHARHERLAVRRGVAQPDVLAGTPARDAERRGDLPLPSALPRRRLRDLVRRRRPRLGHGAHGGRRHDAGRRWRRPRRHGRAIDRAGGEHPRRQHVREGCGAARDRRPDAARASSHAPRHGLHVVRPQRGHALRARRRADPADPLPPGRRVRRPGRGLGALLPRRGQRRARASRT